MFADVRTDNTSQFWLDSESAATFTESSENWLVFSVRTSANITNAIFLFKNLGTFPKKVIYCVTVWNI